MWKEFKEFISKGNVLDLAVAVIIGGAFGKIVTALVDNIIMPLVGVATGGINLTELKWVVGTAEVAYGLFLQAVLDFLIIAFCIFLIVKAFNAMKRKKVEEPEAEPEPTKEEVLLTEIRDLLKEKNAQQ